MKKYIVITSVFIISFFFIRFFCGVYTHDEFCDDYFFIKHRPVWKWSFYSPIGMSDTKMEELSKEEQIEQKYFNEFVTEQGLNK